MPNFMSELMRQGAGTPLPNFMSELMRRAPSRSCRRSGRAGITLPTS
jgi:hypothetical protein